MIHARLKMPCEYIYISIMAEERNISKIQIDGVTYQLKDTVARESSGTVEANPTTTTSSPDLSSLGIANTAYNINAGKLDGHDVDDLTAIINAAYEPEVTTEIMNTTIDAKIQAAIDALEFNKYYTGTTTPANTLGTDGDLYLQQ